MVSLERVAPAGSDPGMRWFLLSYAGHAIEPPTPTVREACLKASLTSFAQRSKGETRQNTSKCLEKDVRAMLLHCANVSRCPGTHPCLRVPSRRSHGCPTPTCSARMECPRSTRGCRQSKARAVLRRSDHYSRAGSSSAEQWMTSLTVHGSHIPGSCWAPFPASSWATGKRQPDGRRCQRS